MVTLDLYRSTKELFEFGEMWTDLSQSYRVAIHELLSEGVQVNLNNLIYIYNNPVYNNPVYNNPVYNNRDNRDIFIYIHSDDNPG